MLDKELIATALNIGFSSAAIIDTAQLVYNPQFRNYCEDNFCGNYGIMPGCPPKCGTPDEMHQRMLQYKRVLVLQTELKPIKKEMSEYRLAQTTHNQLLTKLVEQLQLEDHLLMSCGPWRHYSCMSAYCIDAEKMAEACGMICWGNDGIVRLFSSILFN